MKEWILTVVPIEHIVVVPMFFSIPSFSANQKQANFCSDSRSYGRLYSHQQKNNKVHERLAQGL